MSRRQQKRERVRTNILVRRVLRRAGIVHSRRIVRWFIDDVLVVEPLSEYRREYLP